MSTDQMVIPDKIKVGYNTRPDTYTGKLAYVTYFDIKGKLRKEASWNSWCDSNLGSDEYPNEPTSGFVLNKKVGDYKSDWNHRMAHIRVYDPRGFEFEISVENLLYILQECTSTKGKGLEGDFVYAWDKTELVLLPVTSQEYVKSRAFTDGLTKKVNKKDMQEGCVYITKKQESVMYLGKQNWYDVHSGHDYIYKIEPRGERHVFAHLGENVVFGSETGFTKLSSKVSDVISTDYADVFDKFKKSAFGNGLITFEFVPQTLNLNAHNGAFRAFTKIKEDIYQVHVARHVHWHFKKEPITESSIFCLTLLKKFVLKENYFTCENVDCLSRIQNIEYGKLEKMEFFNLLGRTLDNKFVKLSY